MELLLNAYTNISCVHVQFKLFNAVDKFYQAVTRLMGICKLLSRYEPANARYFQVEINCGNSMVETVKLLGCFEADSDGSNKLTQMAEGPKSEHRKFFQDVFVSDVNSEEFDSLIQSGAVGTTVPRKMVWACVVLRMLYDMAVDNYDKTRSSSASSKPPQLTSSPRLDSTN